MFGNVKKILYIVLFMLCATEVYAQVPQGFNFQAVARGADGVPLISQELGVKVSILAGSETGDVSYMESHTITTNSIGLIQLIIGQGTAIETTFAGVNWSGSNHYVKIEIDPNGGTEYEELGTTQLLAVPYAILAQDVVNGGSGGEAPLNININTADDDTSFVITLEGSDEAKPFQVFSKSTNANRAIWGEAIEEESNENTQRGVLGFANGPGSGGHSGLFGSAVNFGATGGDRIGVYGQAASKAKYNYGVLALAQGDGSGNIVPLGEEVDGDFGSYNIAGGFYSQGNLNGNVGVEAQASGSIGERVDFGLIARAIGSANSPNVGVRGEANNSPVFNTAIEGDASGTGTKNLGLRLHVYNGSSNIGMEVNADTAAILNGTVNVNGDLNYTGSLNNTSDRNLKENIQPLRNGLSTIMQLNPTTYNFRGNGDYNGLKLSQGLHYGLIAQEVELVLPSLVKNNTHLYMEMSSGSNGPNTTIEEEVPKTMNYKTMNYTELIPVLIKAVQEQQEEIEKLRTEIEKLKNEK